MIYHTQVCSVGLRAQFELRDLQADLGLYIERRRDDLLHEQKT